MVFVKTRLFTYSGTFVLNKTDIADDCWSSNIIDAIAQMIESFPNIRDGAGRPVTSFSQLLTKVGNGQMVAASTEDVEIVIGPVKHKEDCFSDAEKLLQFMRYEHDNVTVTCH